MTDIRGMFRAMGYGDVPPWYDGSPEAKARRAAKFGQMHDQAMSEFVQGRTQDKISAAVPPENSLDCFGRFQVDDDPNRQALLDVCMRFSSDPPGTKVLTIIGACGRGKTLLAVSIVRHMLDHGVGGAEDMAYITEKSLMERYDRARSYRSQESTDNVMRRFSQVDVLVVDELGKWAVGRDGIAVLEELVDHRLGRKPTVLLSNLNGKEFSERYGGGFGSRIASSIYGITGYDHRLGKEAHHGNA